MVVCPSFPRSCHPLPRSARLPEVLPHMCACDGISARGLVSPCLHICVPVLDGVSTFPRSCLPMCSLLFPFRAWCVHVPALFPLVFHLPTCACVGVSAFPRSCLPFSHILPACVSVLDGVSAFPRSCLPLSRSVSPLSPIIFQHRPICIEKGIEPKASFNCHLSCDQTMQQCFKILNFR